jgi:hypothetical protein
MFTKSTRRLTPAIMFAACTVAAIHTSSKVTEDTSPASRRVVIQVPSRVCTSSEYVLSSVALHWRATVLRVVQRAVGRERQRLDVDVTAGEGPGRGEPGDVVQRIELAASIGDGRNLAWRADRWGSHERGRALDASGSGSPVSPDSSPQAPGSVHAPACLVGPASGAAVPGRCVQQAVEASRPADAYGGWWRSGSRHHALCGPAEHRPGMGVGLWCCDRSKQRSWVTWA